MERSLFNRKVILIFIIGIIILGLFMINRNSIALNINNKKLSPPSLVAHAGGAIYGFKLTNSLEALEESHKNGFKLIEMDFEWTSDGKIVAIHDWGPMVKRLFMTEERVLSLEEFKNSEVFMDLTLLEFDEVVDWFVSKEDMYLVTDTKGDNKRLLTYIFENHKKAQNRIIPQVYSFEEYELAKNMGFNNIILTLYKADYTDEDIVEFARENEIFAITMPLDRGSSTLPMRLKEIGVFTYVHTINELYVFEELYEKGVGGIYTDFFHANKWITE
ncbi:glycerophosphodiester phosphodiesterase family protein [Schnuerera ultunensis]|uniref:glycerophosphodiester phosphodiesterase family protein n=1 Tax=Schnuerera ultunensis TaxID=45497 RepID=UPI000414682F|nr:glycerophosphodiester phosphodiesterase family protein [Schnuerera ultunensis]